MLSQLIYTSDVPAEGVKGGAVAILDVARAKNAAAGISGILVFDTRSFLQCLEGSREDVSDTYNRIAADSRHRNVTVLAFTDIDERAFPDWSMGYLPLTAAARQIVRRFGPNDELAPRVMPATGVVAMLKALRNVEGTG